MATKKIQDSFANMATIIVTESAANTLTYKKLETNFGTFEKIAWVIHRLDYVLLSASTGFNGTDDSLNVALMVSNTRTSIQDSSTYTDPAVIDMLCFTRFDFGAAASGSLFMRPHTKDFANLPNGGLIIPPAPLYGAVMGFGMASAGNAVIRIYYTIKELATDEYWELVEARRLLTA